MKVEDVPDAMLWAGTLALQKLWPNNIRRGSELSPIVASVFAAVAPLIAAAERERAAKMVEEYGCHDCEMDAELAAAIRARSDAP